VLPRHADLKAHLAGVRDSKQLTPQERERCFQQIVAHAAAIGIGWSSHQTIDRMGIAAANRAAMVRALGHLPTFPDALILDAVRLQDVPVPQVATPRSDAASLSVAAASIVAKVVRDRWMARQSHRFPGYGFADHKGYGTPAHRLALDELGPCSIHRRSFRPIALLVA
jgi:ribonuclease HII